MDAVRSESGLVPVSVQRLCGFAAGTTRYHGCSLRLSKLPASIFFSVKDNCSCIKEIHVNFRKVEK